MMNNEMQSPESENDIHMSMSKRNEKLPKCTVRKIWKDGKRIFKKLFTFCILLVAIFSLLVLDVYFIGLMWPNAGKRVRHWFNEKFPEEPPAPKNVCVCCPESIQQFKIEF